ncbi:hypothetical protein A2U01_0016346, partial [Trifolium medium]|nr:hypothetical protein [Trifolium medium]
IDSAFFSCSVDQCSQNHQGVKNLVRKMNTAFYEIANEDDVWEAHRDMIHHKLPQIRVMELYIEDFDPETREDHYYLRTMALALSECDDHPYDVVFLEERPPNIVDDVLEGWEDEGYEDLADADDD